MADNFIKPPFFQWGVRPAASRGLGEPGAPLEAVAGVHFDGLTALLLDAIASDDVGTLTISYWARTEFGPHPGRYNIIVGAWDAPFDPIESSYGGGSGLQLTGRYEFPANDGSFAEIENRNSYFDKFWGWHHYLISVDITSLPLNIAVYFDGVQVNDIVVQFDGPGVFAYNGTAWLMGTLGLPIQPFVFPGPFANAYIGDLAQFWLHFGTSLLTGPNTISPANIAKFYSPAGPVSLGADGSLPTGTPPTFYLNIAPGDPATDFLLDRSGNGNHFHQEGGTEPPDLRLSETDPPTFGPPFTDVPVVVGLPNVGETASVTIPWPRPILNVEYSWREDNNAEVGTMPTYTFNAGDLTHRFYVIIIITDAIGRWPVASNIYNVYFGPILGPLPGNRITDNGDDRVTDAGDQRVTAT